MNDISIDNYYTERFKPRLQWYDRKSIINKRLTYLFQIPIITVAAITPILAALQYTTLTVIFSTFVAAGIGILKFGNFESLWRNYRNAWEDMQREFFLYKSKIDIYKNSKNPKKLFIERIEAIISREQIRWKLSSDKDYSEYLT